MRTLTLLFFFLLCAACSDEAQYSKITGSTMGTSYSVILESDDVSPEKIYQAIEVELQDINQLMSTYIADSEINRFNALSDDSCFSFSDKTWEVLKASKQIYEETNGAFDITLGPLISRWGFNAEEYDEKVPSNSEINHLLNKVGTDKLTFDNQRKCIAKQIPSITINLSAIAKGYGVDRVAHVVEQHGVQNYLIEIGGETKAKGVNPSSNVWRVAIENPTSAEQRKMLVVGLTDTSIATSGDYRNFFMVDGKRFSHTIDPTSGYPVEHSLASVSVIHPQNMYADAYATAFSVMGTRRTLELAEHKQLPVFIVEHQLDSEHKISTHSSSSFNGYAQTY